MGLGLGLLGWLAGWLAWLATRAKLSYSRLSVRKYLYVVRPTASTEYTSLEPQPEHPYVAIQLLWYLTFT